MGYIFLSLSVLAGATKGFFGKKTSMHIEGFRDAMLANTVRMMMCVIIGAAVVIAGGDLHSLAPSWEVLLISAMSGIATSGLVVFWMVSVKTSAYMLVDVVLMTGTLIPVIGNTVIFGEPIKMQQWIGIGILIFAAGLMCSYNNSLKKNLTAKAVVILILCGASGGLGDLSQKLFVNCSEGAPVSVFNFYTYVFSALVLIVCYYAFGIKERLFAMKFRTPNVSKKVYLYIAIMSACLFAASYFKTFAAGYLDAVYLYPLSQGAAMIFSSFMAWVFFGEKITAKCAVGIALSFIGVLIVNFA